jgi:hypothetical protein
MEITMSQWRVSYVFRNAVGATPTGGSLYGWSENLYYSVDSDASQVAVAAARLLAPRLAMLTPGWRISRIRYAIYPGTRAAFSQSPTPAAGRGTYPAPSEDIDQQPYDKLLISLVCASGKGRVYTLGGISTDSVDAGGVYLAPARMTDAFPPWQSQLATGWAVRRITRGTTINGIGIRTGAPSTVPGASPVTPVILYSNTVPLFNDGDIVRISSVLGMKGANGIWTVQSATLDGTYQALLLRQKRGVVVLGTYVGGGTITKITYSLDGIVLGGTPSRGSSRRTGGPTDRPRGRRSRRQS